MAYFGGAAGQFNTGGILNIKVCERSAGTGNGIITAIDLLPAAICSIKTNKAACSGGIFPLIAFIGDQRLCIILPFLSFEIHHRFFVNAQLTMVYYIGEYSSRIAGEIDLSFFRHVKAWCLRPAGNNGSEQQQKKDDMTVSDQW